MEDIIKSGDIFDSMDETVKVIAVTEDEVYFRCIYGGSQQTQILEIEEFLSKFI